MKSITENTEIQQEGELTNIIFRNEETGYTVAILKTEAETFSVVGRMHMCSKGAYYKLRGQFVMHPKYGRQFSFNYYEERMPTTKSGIRDFLASGIIRGMGPKMAAKIVEVFGEQTLRVIEETPERLMEISGIGEKKVNEITSSFEFQKELADIVIFLRQYGISVNFSKKLYEIFGSGTLDELRSNPYVLTEEEIGAGFRTADELARQMGIEAEDERRLEKGLKYVLEELTYDGNTFFPKNELIEKAGKFLDVSMELLENVAENLDCRGEIKIDELQEREVVYLWRYYIAEVRCAGILSELIESRPKPLNTDVETLIDMTRARIGIQYSQEQKSAILEGVNNSVCVITGGPGTGKTTIINGILDIFSHSGLSVAIAAPTGRAAKRITEATGYEAGTIHRLLGYNGNPESEHMNFARNAENPLKEDVVVVDEASMIDLLLMQGLLEAMSPGTRLIIVGDADQLPPVGAGNVLRDIINGESVACFNLKEIFRQAGESMIVINAHKINEGEYPDLNRRDKDFFMIESHNEQDMVDTIKDLCLKRLPTYYNDINPLTDIQILTPSRKSRVGSVNLNRELQEVLNPYDENKSECFRDGRIFRDGDKVMQIKNNYDLLWKKAETFEEGYGIFNGDMGIIEKVDNELNEITVLFDGDKYVRYDMGNIDELDIAYAVTVHKSQGSEFPIVLMPISRFPPMLATRNLLYTAVTRGKRLVVLVGSPRRLCEMVDNMYDRDRYSGLDERLKKLCFLEDS